MTKRFIKAVINREYSLITALEDLGVVSKGSLQLERTCYCPFHDNTESKAAKIYDDELGVTLFCFAEQKSFRSSDAIERFSKEPLMDVFNRIWNKLSESDKSYYLDNFENSNDVLSPEWKETVEKLKAFKAGTIDYSQVCDIILETVKGEKHDR